VATVNVHVRDVAQLFNSLDPSPFWDRDLDRDAATFIEEEFSDKRSADEWHLTVHARDDSASTTDLQLAVENYYTRLASSARRELREHLRFGELALLGGLAIFVLAILGRELLTNAFQQLPQPLDEGLIILGWLALWRPAEMLAYEWVPILRKRRQYERLAGIRVSIRRPVPPKSPG
jgi:hypothetical protein